MTAMSLAVLLVSLYADYWRPCCGALRRLHPVVKKLHRPHHAMFSADPSPCPCMSNLQSPLSDEEVSRLKRSGVALPPGPIISGVDRHGKTKYYPADYGNTCEAWDTKVDPACDQKFPPAQCTQRWCFVNPDCAKLDTHRSAVFPSSERYVSFEACGSFDAQQAYSCHTHFSEKSCSDASRGPKYPAGGNLCEWNKEIQGKTLRKSKQTCQPERCRCTGQHVGGKLRSGSYGSQCGAWDREKCEEWQEVPNSKMGVWCCQSWCYVDASCPSASPSSTTGLYWSYAACAEDPEMIRSCPWKEPIGWQGEPITLSDGARHILKNPARTEKKEEKLTWSTESDLSMEFLYNLIVANVVLLLLCLICCCCCCARKSSSDENQSPPPPPPAPPAPAAPVGSSSQSVIAKSAPRRARSPPVPVAASVERGMRKSAPQPPPLPLPTKASSSAPAPPARIARAFNTEASTAALQPPPEVPPLPLASVASGSSEPGPAALPLVRGSSEPSPQSKSKARSRKWEL